MQLNDYLKSLQSKFALAKQNAEQAILASDIRNLTAPVARSLPPVIAFGDNVAQLSALNSASPVAHFDITRTTPRTYENYPLPVTTAVIDDGIKTHFPAKQVEGELAGIDWVNITMSAVTFDDENTHAMTSEGLRHNALVKNISYTLETLLGFGIEKQNSNGIHFYQTSYQLQHNAGTVALGGQNDSVLIMINGTGCDYARAGWQYALHSFLTNYAINPKITRLDLAHDDLKGEYTNLAWFAREYDKGGFNNGSRKPTIEMRGNWKTPDGKGRTLYIGSPKSPRYCRIYEKGKQLGDPESPWVRTEVEYKAKGMIIDLDALIAPSNFFAMTYPCFHVFDKKFNYEQKKFERITQEQRLTFEKSISITKHQFGRFINCFRQEFHKHNLTDSDLLDLLTSINNPAYPERLDVLTIPDFFKPKPTH